MNQQLPRRTPHTQMAELGTPPSSRTAFDEIASSYDAMFTESPCIRAQRRVVWRAAQQVFRPGNRILELNCGTGEDALLLARSGIAVVACDASEQMIAVARRRQAMEGSDLPITFLPIATERISSVADGRVFDGVFSNFSGLNFVSDLAQVARDLALLTRPGAPLLLCCAPRICCWETLWFCAHLDLRKSVRRFPGFAIESVGAQPIEVWYRTVREVRRQFAPLFRLRCIRAVGLCVPPYYADQWARRHKRLLRVAETCDRVLCRVPLLRVLGDHVLLHFERRVASRRDRLG